MSKQRQPRTERGREIHDSMHEGRTCPIALKADCWIADDLAQVEEDARQLTDEDADDAT